MDTLVPRDGGAHYDAGGVKARRYSGSSKPDGIPPFLWKTMSMKQRRLAIIKEEREKARKAFPDEPVSEDAEASSSKAKPATTAVNNGLVEEFSIIPLMPVAPCVGNHSDEKTIGETLDVVVLPALSANPDIGQHRCKVLQAHLRPIIHATVARPVGGGKRLRATTMPKSLLMWSGTTLRVRAHGITTLCVSGCK